MKGDKRFALIDDKEHSQSWPTDFKALVKGYEQCQENTRDHNRRDKPPLLGIRLDKFDLAQVIDNPFDGNVVVSVSNVGGCKGSEELPIGGTSIYYLTDRTKDGWRVEWQRVQHP
jgi:hypothetical protein